MHTHTRELERAHWKAEKGQSEFDYVSQSLLWKHEMTFIIIIFY